MILIVMIIVIIIVMVVVINNMISNIIFIHHGNTFSIGTLLLESVQNMLKEHEAATLPKFNIAPENGWLEYYFPIGEAYFQGLR